MPAVVGDVSMLDAPVLLEPALLLPFMGFIGPFGAGLAGSTRESSICRGVLVPFSDGGAVPVGLV